MKTLFTIILLTAYSLPLTATIRYVSHTGSSTPPYTSWETAADSIQKCINYSVAGDTIIVANGVYYESLVVNKYLWLIGSSMDSTVIDGTGLTGTTVAFSSDAQIRFFTIKGNGNININNYCIYAGFVNVFIVNCKLQNAGRGIALLRSSSIVNQCFITNVIEGYTSFCSADTCNPVIDNSIIIVNNVLDAYGIRVEGGGNTATNNIVLMDPGFTNSRKGIGVEFDAKRNNIKNNIVSGFRFNIDAISSDTAIAQNNISLYGKERGYTINALTGMRNNISANNEIGLVYPSVSSADYNLFWNNSTHTTGELAEHDIVADPMLVNDTIPVYGGTYDYHLQMYSPAKDAGDPNILDVDGSRSDLGIFGGPLGQIYTYQDLAPKSPANLTAVYDSGLVKLTWNKNTETDLFRYRVYRDTVPNFIYDTTKIIAVVADTFYFDDVPEKYLAGNYYYKITAIDSAYHQSAASEEVHVMITGVPEGPPIVVEEYKLLNNYPNPFNPSTKIPYRLKEGGYVKLIVYDIKGELMKVLVNEHQNAGYYEVEFSPNESEVERGKLDAPFETGYRGDIASGIYLYRIEVIGEGRIPRFSDMKKMILVK